jgi:hypothetical protein
VIERTQLIREQGLRPEEEQAIMIVWRQRGRTGDEVVPEADALQILGEIRERQAAIEKVVLGTLSCSVSENRWYPRRHMQFALLIVLPIAFLLIVLATLIGR